MSLHIHANKVISNISKWTYMRAITSVAVSSTIMDVFGTLIFPQTKMMGIWAFLGCLLSILAFNFEFRSSKGCGKKIETPDDVKHVEEVYIHTPHTHSKLVMNIVLITETILTCATNVCARLLINEELKPEKFIMIVNSSTCILLFLGVIPWIMSSRRTKIAPLEFSGTIGENSSENISD